VPAIAKQTGITGRVIDIHGEAWRAEPRRPGDGQAKARPACCDYCCPGCTRLDRWVASLGGYASARYIGLCAEARQSTSSPGEQWRYLEMAQAADEEHAAGAGRWLAREIELANARSAREARRAALKAAEDAAADCLQRVTEIQLAVQQISERLPADPDFSTGQGLSSAEVSRGLLAAMGLADPQSGRYEEPLPPVGDLARSIGLRQ